jgi:hypothetical protein
MLKWLTIIGTAALIITVIFVARYDKFHDTQGKGYDIKCAQPSDTAATVNYLICTAEHSQKIKSGEYDPVWWHIFFAWPEGITTLLLLLTLVAISFQTYYTRKAAEASLLSAQALVNAERARIGFDVSEMGRSFQIDGKNNGKTSARIMYAHGFTAILAPEESLPLIPPYIGKPDDDSEWIGPGDKFDLLTAPDRYGFIADLGDIALCQSIRDKKAVLWAFGCIRYFDGVSLDRQEKRFCFATSVDESLETYMFTAGPEEYRRET